MAAASRTNSSSAVCTALRSESSQVRLFSQVQEYASAVQRKLSRQYAISTFSDASSASTANCKRFNNAWTKGS